MRPDTLSARKSIESLRAGVPSRSVVEQLGTDHTDIEDAFLAALQRVKAGQGVDPVGCTAPFGQGKTHLLIHLRVLAEKAGFATSVVVVSPETPLGNPSAVLAEICRNASVEGRVGDALRELQTSARTDTSEWAEFRVWARDAGIVQRFQALMMLYEALTGNVGFRVRILEEIQGKPIALGEIRTELKQLGQASAYDLRGTPRASALVPERIRLLARWFRAFGRHGLVVFFDELERLGNFSLRQRMAAYEQIAWWTDMAREDGAAVLPVWFSTHELDTTREQDMPRILTELVQNLQISRSRNPIPDLLSRSPRWRGLEELGKLAVLSPPSLDALRSLQARVAELYERAYGLDHVADLEIQSQSDTVRQEIRRWVAHWDMQRLYPDDRPDITVGSVEDDKQEWDETLVPDNHEG